jgi:hypothetical protein
VFGFFNLKVLLLGLLVASPAIGLWSYRSHNSLISNPEKHSNASALPLSAAEPVVRIPVEVIANGSAPEWVYVEVGTQAVPEPGLASLLALTALLLAFRRQRG